ncbi:growth-regulating factor 7-like [Punica granatum]|uniref:Growth-regulating factor 7-like n=2 Tax=Punica granatum TaxID=22663 RepID=A0A6P8C756_PUNGR|nr:growth-regulating factor 7-like [Punica granatum]PKI72471.1 hypothetical protein CRG98_007138 [Punica granatum]
MDLGAVGFGGWGVGSDPEAKHRLYGHGSLFKQGRAACDGPEDDLRSSKVAKAEDLLSAPKKAGRDSDGASLLSNGSSPVFFSAGNHHHHQQQQQQQQHMLCFSSSKSDAPSPHLSHSSSSLYGANVNGALFSRGPFTPSQYMELEHQALIYKYIVSNVPVPLNLLIPIKKAFDSAVLACHSSGLFRPNALGWGSFHLGFSRSTDPEPGRCRRTDGKKWRCSKEAVADQKYCEKHMNRGRHRSRKPVEGQTGHSVSGATTTAPSTNIPAASALVGPGSGVSNSMTLNRMLMNEGNVANRMKDPGDLYLLSPAVELKSKENSFLISSKQQFLEMESHHSVHQFMDDWPENHSADPAIAGAGLDLQSDGTQLSIAIPTMSSPENKKSSSFFQFGSLQEMDKVEMIDLGVGVGNKQASYWVPISRENSIGGPLGEALKSTNNSSMGCKTLWVSTSPSLQSSPTGVLQRTTFVSLSNSSAGSSPRADNSKNLEEA